MANETKAKGVADVIFLMDITDSMDYCIDAVKKNICLFVQELQKGKIDWRARIIGFRNYNYDQDNWIDADESPFTKDVNELQRKLDSKEAKGGDPNHYEESVLDALHYVSQLEEASSRTPDPLKWRPTGHAAKCVLLFTDAGCQETVSYYPGNLDLGDVGQVLRTSRIRLSIVAPDYECYHDLAEWGAIFIPCGKHEDFREMRLCANELTPQEKAANRKSFEDILLDFARTVTATATEEAD